MFCVGLYDESPSPIIESLEQKSTVRSLGYDFDWLLERVLGLFGLTLKELLTGESNEELYRLEACYAIGERESWG
jgi:hypothetical protein